MVMKWKCHLRVVRISVQKDNTWNISKVVFGIREPKLINEGKIPNFQYLTEISVLICEGTREF